MNKKQARRSSAKATEPKKVDLRKFIKADSRFILLHVYAVLKVKLKCEAAKVEELVEQAIRLGYILEDGKVGLYPGIPAYRLNPEKEPILTL